MKPTALIPRILAFFLSLALSVPSPASALHQLEPAQNSGLEEKIAGSLGHSTLTTAGLEEPIPDNQLPEPIFVARQHLRALLRYPGEAIWQHRTETISLDTHLNLGSARLGAFQNAPRMDIFFPMPIPQLIRRVTLPQSVDSNQAIGFVGFHLGQSGNPNLLNPLPVVGLIYRHGMTMRFWMQNREGMAREMQIPLSTRGRAYLNQDGIYSIFLDQLLVPKTMQDALNLAEWLIQRSGGRPTFTQPDSIGLGGGVSIFPESHRDPVYRPTLAVFSETEGGRKVEIGRAHV